jgi:hypothetical protein
MPQGTRSRLFIRFDHWNVRRDEPAAEGDEGARWSAETEARLRAHFAADEAALADRFALELPWA